MTGLQFRRAQEADIPAIVALLADDVLGRQREDASSPPNPKYLEAFRAIDADPHQLQAVAVLEDEVIGTLQITFIPGLSHKGAWRGQIESVRIAARHRGSGLGRQMVEWSIDQCRTKGCQLVQLMADKGRIDADRFYVKLGFTGRHVGYRLAL